MEDKGTLVIYIENDEFVIERITPFNHSFKQKYLTENGLREGLEAHKPIIYQMNLKVQQDAKMQDGMSLLERATDILFERENH